MVGAEPASLARIVRRASVGVHGGAISKADRSLERISGKEFDLERLRSLMEGVNRQEEYFEEVAICDLHRAADAGSHAGAGQQRHGRAMAARIGMGRLPCEEISR